MKKTHLVALMAVSVIFFTGFTVWAQPQPAKYEISIEMKGEFGTKLLFSSAFKVFIPNGIIYENFDGEVAAKVFFEGKLVTELKIKLIKGTGRRGIILSYDQAPKKFLDPNDPTGGELFSLEGDKRIAFTQKDGLLFELRTEQAKRKE